MSRKRTTECKRSGVVLLLGAAGLLAACNGGSSGGNGPPTFNLSVQAPGSGFAGDDAGGFEFDEMAVENFTLGTGVVVTGQVTDGAGAPLSGVEVAFKPSSKKRSIDDDSTNGTGDYSVTVGAGSWVAEIEGPSALGTMSTDVTVTGPGPVTLDFQFPATVTVSGVVSEMMGPAIGSATVDFEGQDTGASVSVVCGGAGFYSADLVPDTYDAVVTPAGGASATHLKERFTDIVVSGTMARGFNLSPGVQVSGFVLDDFGAPLLEDTDVDIVLAAGSNYFAPADVQVDDNDGSYSIGPVPSGNITFELEPPGDTGFPRQQVTVSVVGPTTQTEDLQLAAGYILSGTVLEDDGVTPSEDVEVEATPTDGSLAPDDDDTNGSGFYEISLFAGEYDVMFTPDDPGDMQLPEVQTITVAANMTLDVTLTRGAMLQGNVTEPGGITDAEDVRVWIAGVLGASDVTDSDGDYTFLAPAGTHTLNLEVEDGTFRDVTVDPVTGVVVALPGPVTQDIELAPSVTGNTFVTGWVYEPDGTTPIVGAEVVAYRKKTGEVLGRGISVAGGVYTVVVD